MVPTGGLALPARAALERDVTKRAAMLQEAEAIFLADLPVFPIYHYTTQHLVKPYVSGWVDNILDYHPSRWIVVNRPGTS